MAKYTFMLCERRHYHFAKPIHSQKKSGLWDTPDYQDIPAQTIIEHAPLPPARTHAHTPPLSLSAGTKCETPVTIVTWVIKLQVAQEMHNYRVIRLFSNVSAIRLSQHCQRALSKYTLGQLCNYTFLDPCCHTLFFISLYEESIPEVLPLSFNTPYIYTKLQLDVCLVAVYT
jgi:hypothetical protein